LNKSISATPTLINKPTSKQAKSARTTNHHKSALAGDRSSLSTLNLRPTVAKLAGPRLPGATSDGPEPSLDTTRSARFLHTFSQIPIYPKTRTNILPKLSISQPNDSYEQEADRVADRVMRMPDGAFSGRQSATNKGNGKIQTKTGWRSAGQLGPRPSGEALIASVGGQGMPLSDSERSFFEPRFGWDFSKVRIHTDNEAHALSNSVSARAFAVGNDMVFGAGQYAMGSNEGRRLMAHELAHVVQQNAGGARQSCSSTIQREPLPTPSPTKPTSPAQEAVNALKPNAKGFDVSYLSVPLLEGIVRAEAGVLADRWVSSPSFGKTQGPGQLGVAEIKGVDDTFVTARDQFATVYPGPPGTWKEKANDPNWAYFYTAAAYLMKLDVAQRKLQPSPALMSQEGAPGTQISDQAMGIHELGLVTYHGGFDRMAAYRRRIAGDTPAPLATTTEEAAFRKSVGITSGFKRWQVTEEMMLAAIRENLFMQDDEDRERLHEMETYLQNVAGGFDFDFDVAIYLEASRRFYVAQGTVTITVSADFPDDRPGNAPAEYYKYYIQLSSDSSELLSSRVLHTKAAFSVGGSQSYRWTNLPAGHYRFSVEQRSGPILHGTGRVEFG
jgi:Domain of unknown function (DUF4157)